MPETICTGVQKKKCVSWVTADVIGSGQMKFRGFAPEVSFSMFSSN